METLVAEYTPVIRESKHLNSNTTINYITAKKAAKEIRAVDHIIRKNIIQLLEENGRMRVNDIYAQLRLLQPIVSQHLAIMRKANIVTMEFEQDDFRAIYYSINHDRIAEIATSLNNVQ